MSDHHGTAAKPLPIAHPLKRRGLLIGAGAAGAAALAVKTLPVDMAASVAEAAPKVVETTGGYQLSAHVLRYYETTRA